MRFLLAALALGGCASVTPARTYDFSAVEARLVAACADGTFSGVVAVSVAEERVFTHVCGLADVERNTPITLDSTYRIFSSSKLLVALTVMRMVERRKIELDAPVSRYVAEAPASWSSMTVRHLLQHTTGVPDLTNDYVRAFCAAGGASEGIAFLMESDDADTQLAPQTPPGETFRYNNFTYEVLTEVAERGGGALFADLIRREVFEPSGMSGALLEQGRCDRSGLTSEADPNLVTGYNGSPTDLRAVNPPSFVQRGAGGVHANVADMLALGEALLRHGVVGEATWVAMTSNLRSDAALPPGNAYGLGVIVRSTPVRALGHTGGNNGYGTSFDVLPDFDAVLVIMSNRSFSPRNAIRDDIYAAFAPQTEE